MASFRAPISRADHEKRQAIVNACRHEGNLFSTHLVIGHAGRNHQHSFAMTNADVARCALVHTRSTHPPLDGSFAAGQQPSREWRSHHDVRRSRPEVHTVVHAHPTYRTILSIMGLQIPPVRCMIAVAGGGSILCVRYASFSTLQLSQYALTALEDGFACLLAYHAMITLRLPRERALWLAVEVETLAGQYHGCSQIGTPRSLPEIERDRLKMAGYGHACANHGE